MSSHAANSATSAHRAQIVAEAVVSAYIHEITPSHSGRTRGRAGHGHSESSRATARRSPTARAHRRPLARRRPSAMR